MSLPLPRHLARVLVVGLSVANPVCSQASPAPALIGTESLQNPLSIACPNAGRHDFLRAPWDLSPVGQPLGQVFHPVAVRSIPNAASLQTETPGQRSSSLPSTDYPYGARPSSDAVPYMESGTPGITVRFIPSSPPARGLRQVYVKPGASDALAPAFSRVPSQDPKYTKSVPGPNGTRMMYLDPALAIYATARVTPTGKVETVCDRLPSDCPSGPSPHTHPVATVEGDAQ